MNRGNGLRGHFIGPKTRSLGVNLALHEFSYALNRCRPTMQNQFGSQVCARESDTGHDDREYEVVNTHGAHPSRSIDDHRHRAVSQRASDQMVMRRRKSLHKHVVPSLMPEALSMFCVSKILVTTVPHRYAEP
jgi:hypothetical protein